jgi:hypothetical protein
MLSANSARALNFCPTSLEHTDPQNNPLEETMKPALVFAQFALTLIAGIASGQTASAPTSQAFPRFTQTQGNLDSDGLPTSGAKLCVIAKPPLCYQMPSETAAGSTVAYQFGLQPLSQRLTVPGGGSWIFFSSMFSAGGSGTLTRLAVLRYQGAGNAQQIVNLMPFVAATNVSEFAMWTVPTASPYPILVHADFVWGDGEAHFDPHFYTVEAWKFDPGTGLYGKTFQYQTSQKYSGGDSSPVHVLTPERDQIMAHLNAK